MLLKTKNLFFLFVSLFVLALMTVSCTQDRPRDYDTGYRNNQDSGYDNTDVEDDDTRYRDDNRGSNYRQQEDHTLRNGLLAAGAGYAAGRLHANYNQKKQASTQSVSRRRTEPRRYTTQRAERKSRFSGFSGRTKARRRR